MKTLKLILIVMAISFTTNMQAQLLKKLSRTAEHAVERTLDRKVNEKATKETEKTFDSTFNTTPSHKEQKRQKSTNNNTLVNKSYTFTHKFVMQIESEGHTTNINYFLNSSENYIGSSMDLGNKSTKMISIMDMSTKKATMFMEINNRKTQMSVSLDLESMTDDAIKENDVKITPTGNTKTILNLTCHEYKVKGKDYYGNIWVTQDAEVSFGKTFHLAKTKKGLNQSWMSMINGLTLEMNITNTSKRKAQVTVMKCIALEKINLTIKGSDYKKMI